MGACHLQSLTKATSSAPVVTNISQNILDFYKIFCDGQYLRECWLVDRHFKVYKGGNHPLPGISVLTRHDIICSTQIKEYVKVSSDHKGQVILANDTVRSPPRPSFHSLCLEELCLLPVISVFPV